VSEEIYASQADIDGTARRLNASNTTLYAVDARGLALDRSRRHDMSTLNQLARKTGGRAYTNRNDIDELVTAALRESRDGYVLSYYATDSLTGRTRHRIRIKTTRDNVRLRYRRTYDEP
jgi:VWFA-related protein